MQKFVIKSICSNRAFAIAWLEIRQSGLDLFSTVAPADNKLLGFCS
jgi:hypothetical protein